MTRRGEATKQRILDAAVSLFAEGGFRAVRISHVCDRANVSPTSVYWHFENKSQLIQAVLETTFQPIGDQLIAGSKGAKNADALIRSLEKLVVDQPVGALTMLAYVADNLQDDELEHGIAATRKKELSSQIELLSKRLSKDRATARHISLLVNACVNYAGLVKLSGGSRGEIRQILQALKLVLH